MKAEIITHACIQNAKALFKELEGEFYPFGYVSTDDRSFTPYYVAFDDEFPDVNEVMQEIATALISDIQKDKFTQGALCSFCTKTMDGVVFEFLDIKTLNDKGESKDYTVLMDPDYKNYTFELIETFEHVGTIHAYDRK